MPSDRKTTHAMPETFENLQACADERGVIAAAAMDQRGSLKRALAKAGGREVTAAELEAFKLAVTEVLTPHASAVLLDPLYGLGASRRRAPGTGLLLAYEESGYDNSRPGRLPQLLDGWSALRLAEADANGVKLLLYYDPDDDPTINETKHAFIERVGAECEAIGRPFFLEPITYQGDLGGLELARRKPELVRRTMAEFSRPRYRVTVLKVEFPFVAAHTAGLAADNDNAAYDREQAMSFARDAAAAAAGTPFIYLSAGVDMDVFLASLELVGEAGVPFSGVLCGRATWKGGIPVFARDGEAALRAWLADEGVANIERLNTVVARYARPWWDAFGGREQLELLER